MFSTQCVLYIVLTACNIGHIKFLTKVTQDTSFLLSVTEQISQGATETHTAGFDFFFFFVIWNTRKVMLGI